MKTKKFLLATAGSTVDGRNIDEKMLQEMASSYDPKTYAALLNIEHVRGYEPAGSFGSYGDVLELSTETVMVNFNGVDEERLGLYGILDVNDAAKELNDAGQKRYPSIEIVDNFAGKGFAYLVGCALTNSPASIATEKLQFNRRMPGAINVTSADSALPAAAIEFAEEAALPAEAKSMFTAFTEMMKSFTAGNKPAEIEKPKASEPADQMAAFTAMVGEMAKSMEAAVSAMSKSTADQISKLTADVTALSETIEKTANPYQLSRPRSDGANAVKTDC